MMLNVIYSYNHLSITNERRLTYIQLVSGYLSLALNETWQCLSRTKSFVSWSIPWEHGYKRNIIMRLISLFWTSFFVPSWRYQGEIIIIIYLFNLYSAHCRLQWVFRELNCHSKNPFLVNLKHHFELYLNLIH